MNVWIDCGAHKGETTRRFCEDYGRGYQMYAFEANPACRVVVPEEVEVIHKAVWVSDSTIPFFVHKTKPDDDSCTTMRKKKHRYVTKRRTVEAIDFSRWVSEHIKPDDFCVLKMDIEGAEYIVLEKMVAEGTICAIDVAFVEWHHDRVGGISAARHNKLVSAVGDKTSLFDEYRHDWKALQSIH